MKVVKSALRDSLLVVEVSNEKGDPLGLVQAAVRQRNQANRDASRYRDDNLRFDSVWCVVDVDEHARLQAAIELAQREKISLAVSNPCFELWIILHFADQRAYLTTKQAEDVLDKHLTNYDKHVSEKAVRGRYVDARRRAEELQMMHTRNGTEITANPSTDVWHLVDALLTSARRAGGRSQSASYQL